MKPGHEDLEAGKAFWAAMADDIGIYEHRVAEEQNGGQVFYPEYRVPGATATSWLTGPWSHRECQARPIRGHRVAPTGQQ